MTGVPKNPDDELDEFRASLDRDWSVCPEHELGLHNPRPAPIHDREMPDGYFTIQCVNCGQTTGWPMPNPDEIDWG